MKFSEIIEICRSEAGMSGNHRDQPFRGNRAGLPTDVDRKEAEMGDKDQKCLFCGKPKSATNKRFIGGGGAIICEDCIKASNDILIRLRKSDEEKKRGCFLEKAGRRPEGQSEKAS